MRVIFPVVRCPLWGWPRALGSEETRKGPGFASKNALHSRYNGQRTTDNGQETMTANIDRLLAAVRREADRAEFPIDEPVYRRSGRDPRDPILFAGSLEAPVGIVGRDLGKDEVAAGQRLSGAAGRLVRGGLI